MTVIAAAIAALFAFGLVIGIIGVFSHKPYPGLVKPQGKVPSTGHSPYKGTIAIVLDDFGYTSKNFEILSQIRFPLTLSVLPRLPFSSKVGEQMHSRFEVILHLPMEPKETTTGLEANTILTTMDETTIHTILDNDLANLKFARGVSNHMGSKATEDSITMRRVLIDLKKRGIFFLDSFSTPKSVCVAVARDIGIRWARRDVFLDNRLIPSEIRKQLTLLKRKALKNGAAVGIGHDRAITLEVLKEEMPRMAAEGYDFVFVSDMLN
jgi:uncharacterized protein